MTEPDPIIDPKRLERGECTVCGYVYEPVDGDRGRGITPGTAFESLPEGWQCPSCRSGRDRFRTVGARIGTFAGLEENAKFGIGVNILNPQIKNLLIFGALLLGAALLFSFYFTGQ